MLNEALCQWIAALARTIVAGCAVAAIVGGVTFYGEFRDLRASVKVIETQVGAGILPNSERLIAVLDEIARSNRADIAEIERRMQVLESRLYDWR